MSGGKHPGGRPSKYEPEYCDLVVEHLSGGASLTSFAAEISVSRATINVWMDAHPEFLEATKIAKAKCAAWWEQVNRDNAQGGGGNATSCIFGLKNMAADDWKDRQQHEHSGPDGGPVTTVTRRIIDPAKADG
jgi:hypothetical protein